MWPGDIEVVHVYLTADERRAARLTECSTNGVLHGAFDRPAIAKPYFRFGRVHVHVDRAKRRVDEDDVGDVHP